MKRATSVLIVSLIVAIQSAAQSKTGFNNDKEYHGAVRTLTIQWADLIVSSGTLNEGMLRAISDHTYDEMGNEVQSISYAGIGRDSRRQLSRYDAQGNLLERINYGEGDAIRFRSVWKYDSEGKKTELERYDGQDALTRKTVYKYDENGRLVERIHSNRESLDGRTVYQVDAKGRRTSQTTYRADGSISEKITCAYDDTRNSVEMARLNARDGVDYKLESIADSDGKLTQLIYYRSNGSKAWMWTFLYEKNGYLTGEEFQKGKDTFKTSYAYELDAKGNWTKKTVAKYIPKDNKDLFESGHIIYRSFNYYPDRIKPHEKRAQDEEPEILSAGVLQGEAIKRVTPIYPYAARREGASGVVVVEITIDEEGKVISTKALSGPTALRSAATAAAREWEFRPTFLSGFPVKVIGSLSFVFGR